MMTKDKFLSHTSKISHKKVLVIGDIGLDVYVSGTADRLSPEAPVPVLLSKNTKDCLGLAANVGSNITSLGSSAHLIGLVGNNHVANTKLEKLCSQMKVQPQFVQDRLRQTTVKTRFVAYNHQLLRVDEEDSHDVNESLEHELKNAILSKLSTSDAVIIQDYAKGVITDRIMKFAIKSCFDYNLPIIVDPTAKRDCAFYSGCTIIKPNKLEAYKLAELSESSPIHEVAVRLKEKCQAEHVVITLGCDGAYYYRNRANCGTIPTKESKVFDVSGAGDSFLSMLTIGFCNGLSVPEAIELSNAVSGVVVSKPNTSTTTLEEVLEHYF